MKSWLGQVTTGHGAMLLGPTVLAVLSGQMTWMQAAPLLMAGVVGLLWPEAPAGLTTETQTATSDILKIVALVAGALHRAPPPTDPAAAPAPAPAPAPPAA